MLYAVDYKKKLISLALDSVLVELVSTVHKSKMVDSRVNSRSKQSVTNWQVITPKNRAVSTRAK